MIYKKYFYKSKTTMTTLAIDNAHKLDKCITFDEGPHIYTVNGENGYLSVTTWLSSHFPKFNADEIIKKMMRSKNWTESKYFGQSPFEIKKGWRLNGKQASGAGTELHNMIEIFYNDLDVSVSDDDIAFKYFLEFEENVGSELDIFRTEWCVFDTELRLAGSIDAVFKNADGTYDIYDWKRSKKIEIDNKWGGRATTEVISHIHDCNFNKYAFQLNIYKAILERNYGITINKLFIVIFHPENPNKSYIKMELPDFSKEIQALFSERLKIV